VARFGIATAAALLMVLAFLQLRSELWPFIGMLRENVAYSQGNLIEAKTLLGSVKAHLLRISSPSVSVLLIGICAAVLVSFVVSSSKQHCRNEMGTIFYCCLTTTASALAVLMVTGMWDHHNQILYIPAIFAALCLAPLFDIIRNQSIFLTLSLLIMVALLLGGAGPIRYGSAFKNLPASVAALRTLSPETQRLLVSGPAGIYARLGGNDDRGHAFGVGQWRLACARFHQYEFQSAEILTNTLECVSTVPTLIVGESFEAGRDTWPAWREFVAKAEDLLATDYLCDANGGLRICQRTVRPIFDSERPESRDFGR
jgi:hypothetical protein